MKKLLVIALSLSLLLGFIPGCSQRGPKGTLSAPTVSGDLAENYVKVTATRGDIKKTIKSTSVSTLRSIDAATAYFTVGGTIAKINVKWGDKVKKGDPIASLAEAADYQVALAKAKQALDIAEINLNQGKATAEGGGEVALAQLKWQQAQNNYDTAKTKTEQLRLNAEMLKATYENLAITAKRKLTDLECSYQIAKTKFDAAQINYDYCFLKAPIAGEVTWLGSFMSEGTAVKAFDQAVTIENKSSLAHTYYGSSSDSGYLFAGDIVTVVTKIDGAQYQGRILYTPQTLPGDINYSFGGNSDTFPYIIKLIDYDYSQKVVGDTGGDLQIILADHKNVVLIDTYVLKSYKDNNKNDVWYVTVLIDGVPIRKPITIGIKNGDKTEVTSGLNEGDEVIFIAS